jgi:hypothetical protein
VAANIVLYASGLFQQTQFDKVTRTFQQQLEDLQGAQFTTMNLWAWHVQPNGDFCFNGSLAARGGKVTFGDQPAKLNPQLPKLLAQLRKTSPVDLVLLTVGGAGDNSWANIASDWDGAIANFKALRDALSLDGVDIDYEGGYSPTDQAIITELTCRLAQEGIQTTYCPYENESWWLDCAAAAYAQLGKQPVRWMNLQCYDGGGGNDPAAWVKEVARYPASKLGIADPAAFVVPGWWSRIPARFPKQYASSCPSVIQQNVAAARSSGGVSGAFLYCLQDVYSWANPPLCGNEDVSLTGYGKAIASGLGE